MQLSLNWLAQHVDLEGLDPEEIARQLTLKTALIEGLRDQRAAIAGVVVGEVVTCRPHPGADRLRLCTVAFGGERPAAVVCGAPNVAAGQKVLFAPVGTSLPNGVKLKAAKIRGEVSEGMICAEDELGLGPEHDGILVLGPAHEPGTPATRLPDLADVVLEIDNKSVTHRPDLWGHYGFARELAAIFGRKLRPLELDAELAAGDEGPAIELEPGCGCPLYAGLCVDDVVSRSPDWLRFRLIACGLRPRNLLVDLSNYVMLELGQPTHPFDRDALAGGRIVVRRARPGETLTTLDGVARALTAQDCVIADGERAVALAGIMGGSETEVSDGTRQVFLESAAFDPIGVRRSSSRLGLRTDALARFEKGLDPALVPAALRRYALLLRRLRPSAVVAQHYRQTGAAAAPATTIALSGARLRRHLGAEIPDTEIQARLESIGCTVRAADGRFEVGVPSWRSTKDVTIPEDLIEEVGRLAGYDRVPARQPVGPLRLGRRDALPAIEDRTRDALVAQAFMEVVSYSMVPDAVLATAGWPESVALPRLANPLQSDAARLRPSVAPGLLARLEGWLRHADEVSAFEVGRGYAVGAAGPSGPVEERREAVALLAWREPRDARDVVRALRAVAEETWGRLELPRTPLLSPWAPDAEAPWFHPRRSASLAAEAGGEPLAWLGAVSPNILAAFDVRGSAGLLRLDLARCVALAGGGARFRPIPRFPPVRIDLAFALPYSLPTEDVRAGIRAAGGKLLRGVEGFDVYRGAPLGADERSVAFHLVFQADDRTLTDAEVERVRGRIIEAAQALGAKLR